MPAIPATSPIPASTSAGLATRDVGAKPIGPMSGTPAPLVDAPDVPFLNQAAILRDDIVVRIGNPAHPETQHEEVQSTAFALSIGHLQKASTGSVEDAFAAARKLAGDDLDGTAQAVVQGRDGSSLLVGSVVAQLAQYPQEQPMPVSLDQLVAGSAPGHPPTVVAADPAILAIFGKGQWLDLRAPDPG